MLFCCWKTPLYHPVPPVNDRVRAIAKRKKKRTHIYRTCSATAVVCGLLRSSVQSLSGLNDLILLANVYATVV